MTPDVIETALGEFRTWLQSLPSSSLPTSGEEPETIDLHTIVSQFVALRHEVNLQTKGARTQQEQYGTTLEQLGRALDLLEKKQTEARRESEHSQRESLRPLLKVLVDVYDALSLGNREAQRVQEAILSSLQQMALAASASLKIPQDLSRPCRIKASLWVRWFGSGASAEEEAAAEEERSARARAQQQEQLGQAAAQVSQLLSSLVTGYRMSLERIARALAQQGLETIHCVGLPFDPETMEAVAIAADSGRPPGEVIQEVRRGYHWGGRVFRYAQVSVVKA